MKRNWWLAGALCLATMVAVAQTDATEEDSAAKDDDGGWVSLFDGETLEGWEKHSGEAKYHVEDGAIVGTSVPNTGNTFLCTEEEYADFILEFEFMGHPELNSGVQFRSDIKLLDRVYGYQNELEDENKDRDWFCGIYDEARRGWIYPTKEDEALGEKFGEQGKKLWKNGDWNTIRIECRGDHIQTFLNGEKRADLHDNMTTEGLIGLQVHGVGDREEPMQVKWRNIRIKVLQ